MKAVLINTLKHGGAEKVVLNIVRHLQLYDPEFKFIVLTKSSDEYNTKDTEIFYLSENKNLNKGYSIFKTLAFLLLIIRLRKYVKRNKIKLIQSHLFLASLINVIVKILGGGHKVQIVNHSLVSFESKGGVGGWLKLKLLRFAYIRADLLISISKKMKYDIDENLLRNRKIKHIIIGNPHDVENIKQLADETIDDFHFEQDVKYIITVTRLNKRKRVDVLINTLKIIDSQRKDIELIILGNGNEHQNLIQLSVNLGIEKKVHFLGFRDNPYKYIARSDFYVLSSDSEGLPNVLIEAMICKTIVISTDCPSGPREILAPKSDFRIQLHDEIEYADNGILVPINNPLQLSKAILSVSNNSDYSNMAINNAFSYAHKFDLNKIIAKYQMILNMAK